MLKQCSNPYVLSDIQCRACAAALSDPEFPKSHGADFSSSGEATPTWVRPVVAIGLTLLGVAVSTFGLTGLILPARHLYCERKPGFRQKARFCIYSG